MKFSMVLPLLVIILPAVPLFQMGLPGPLQVFATQPTAMRLLEFPMVLAPTLIVPIFIQINLLTAWQLVDSKNRGKIEANINICQRRN